MSGQVPPNIPSIRDTGDAVAGNRSAPAAAPAAAAALVALRGESSKSSKSTKSTPSNDPTEVSSRPTASTTPRTPQTSATQSPARNQFRVPQSPHSNVGGMPDGESASKSAKVAIPRLKRAADVGEGSTKSGGRHRVNHACEPCRHRKTKCSGERPTCRHCQDFKIYCYYADGKRDRVKKQYSTMQDKVSDYEKILRDLSTRVSASDADLIRQTLDQATQIDDDDDTVVDSVAHPSVELEPDLEASGAESEVSGGRGSTGALDRTEEDFTREGIKATGFMGKNSDVTWLQRLRQENKYGEGTAVDDDQADHLNDLSSSSFRSGNKRTTADLPLPEADQGFSIQDSSYHLNDIAINTYEAVDPYEMPTADHAQQLFQTYMTRVHPSFPVVGRVNLQNQFLKYLQRPASRPPQKWLAILNMIFAIGAKYSHVIQADWQADERDHLIYFTRARLLAIDSDSLFSHADLQLLQVLALMAYYLMAGDQINRSWCIAGLAIRQANALGLNMRNDSTNLSNGLKEIRYRVWWALYVLEQHLCSLTGRVSCIAEEHCTTPLPVPVNEEEFESQLGAKLLDTEHQRVNRAPASNTLSPTAPGSTQSSRSGSNQVETSRSPSTGAPGGSELEWSKNVQPNTALYFLHLVQLCRISHTIFQRIYNPTAIIGHWSDIQARIEILNQQLENWYRTLPAIYDFRRKQRDKDFYESRLTLGFFYYATLQTLYRPCLCRLDRKIPGQSQRSQRFNHSTAVACVVSAQEQIALIPDEPNTSGLLRVGPWANILHILVQSATVLMLEISFRAHHMPQQLDEVILTAKKAIRWLHALGDENLAAARAWKICNDSLHDAVKKVGHQIDDLPTKPPRAADSSTDDSSMSGLTATQSQSYQSFGQGAEPQFNVNAMPFTSMGMPNQGTFPQHSSNPFGHYDQLYSVPGNMDPTQMQFPQTSRQMQYETMPSDAEMNFLNQYTEQQEDLSSRGGQPDRSGFNQ